MLTLLAPTKTKLFATLIIILAVWATQTVSTYLWMSWPFFQGEGFEEFAKKIAEQNPEELGKAVQQLLPGRGVFMHMMFLMPIAEWVTRIVFSYLAERIVMRLAASKIPPHPVRRPESVQDDRPESVSGGGG